MLIGMAQTNSRTTETQSDETALAFAASRDPDSFVQLYHRYLDAIYRYCYRRLETHEAAEDATSQIFERALKSIHQYRGGSFRAWLFRIAYTTVIDTWKRRTPSAPDVAPGIPDTDPTPEERALQRESGENVQRLLAKLTAEQARVVELRLAGLKGSEIAVTMNRSPESVRMLQYRAMERLRHHLKPDSSDNATEASNAPT